MVEDPTSDEKEQADVITKMQISLSENVYARALLICQRRNCTLEAVVEDLLERFMPAAPIDKKNARAKPLSVRAESSKTTD